MYKAGLQGNPHVLSAISAAAIPLGKIAAPVGLILLTRPAEHSLSTDELEMVASISPGLRNSIMACRRHAQPTA